MVSKSALKNVSQYTPLDIDQLRVNVKLQAPIYDAESENNLLLLASGRILTKGTVNNLKNRGVQSVRVHERDLENLLLPSLKTEGSRVISSQRARILRKQHTSEPGSASKKQITTKSLSSSHWKIHSDSFLHQLKPVQATGICTELKTQYQKQFTALADVNGDLYEQLLTTTRINMTQIYGISHISLSQMSQDLDIFVSEGITPTENGNFSRHGLQMSSLAMAMGTQLGLCRQSLTQLSIGCLLHDTGMNKIDLKVFSNKQPLNLIESLELKKHPTITYDLLNQVNDISMVSKIIAYQIHERCDGTGYPRGQRSNQIHPFSKIAAVANEFIELVSLRGGKAELLPYQATEKLVYETARGKFDPNAVRALLQSISLYPVGSLVELNTGQLAVVVRTNRSHYDNPIVEILEENGANRLTNLLDYDDIHVVRAVSQ